MPNQRMEKTLSCPESPVPSLPYRLKLRRDFFASIRIPPIGLSAFPIGTCEPASFKTLVERSMDRSLDP